MSPKVLLDVLCREGTLLLLSGVIVRAYQNFDDYNVSTVGCDAVAPKCICSLPGL